LIFVIFELLLGATRSVEPAYIWVIFIGLSSMLMINTINVTVQYGVPDHLRGRVMSLYVTVFAGSSPIGGLFAGGVAQLWGAPAGFVLGALFSLLFLGLASWQLISEVTMPSLVEVPRSEAARDDALAPQLGRGEASAAQSPRSRIAG
jgi:MFS family permease